MILVIEFIFYLGSIIEWLFFKYDFGVINVIKVFVVDLIMVFLEFVLKKYFLILEKYIGSVLKFGLWWRRIGCIMYNENKSICCILFRLYVRNRVRVFINVIFILLVFTINFIKRL